MDAARTTPDAEVNAVLRELLAGARATLGSQFVGMYLHGSLACGDFDRESDVDFVVVTEEELSAALFSSLREMHARIAAIDSWCATQLDGSYIPRRALRRYDPADRLHPHIDRGVGETLYMMRHDSDWVVQRCVLRESGVTLAGPVPRDLIDPVAPDDLRRAMLEITRGWVASMLAEPITFKSRGYQSYIVLTMCRILYTLQHGAVVSKHAAADWAQASLGARWRPVIERAFTGRRMPQAEAQPDDADETLNLMRYTLARSQQFEPPTGDA